MKSIKSTDHCKLCDHHEKNFDLGIICGLTNKPPAFNNYCNQIKLDDIFIEEIERINKKDYKLKKRKFDIIGGIILFPILGLLVLFAEYWFYNNYYYPYFLKELNRGTYAIAGGFGVLALIFVAGIVLIGKGTGPMFSYIDDLKYSKKDKSVLDEVCRVNGIKYEMEYYPKKNIFDQDVFVKDIKLKNTAIIR